jgi:hypothetical protein
MVGLGGTTEAVPFPFVVGAEGVCKGVSRKSQRLKPALLFRMTARLKARPDTNPSSEMVCKDHNGPYEPVQ